MIKSGWKTTEFWLSIISILLTVFNALAGNMKPDLVAIIVAIITGLYIIARAVVKITASPKDDEILDKISEILLQKGILKEK